MVGAAQGVLEVAENRIHPSKLGALDSGSPAAHHHWLMNATRRGDAMKAGQPIGDDPSACAEVELRPGGDFGETEALHDGELHAQRVSLLVGLDGGDKGRLAGGATTVRHADAQIKHCPRCHADARARFPHEMPGPLLDTASAWYAGSGAITRYLDAMPGARTGLERAVRDLDRTCVRDNYRFFERLWHALRTNEGESMVHLPRYDEVTALGETLMDSSELTPAQHAVVDEWRAAHEQAMTRRRQVERYPDEAAALIETGRYLHHSEDPDRPDDPADPMTPIQRKWRNDVTALRTSARAMIAPGSVHAPHLAVSPERVAAIRRAVADLDDALRTDACRGFDWLAREVTRSAEAAGTIPFYAPRYRELAAWAEMLAVMDGLPDATRRLLADWREDHGACLRRRAEIEAFPARAAALLAAGDGHEPWRRDATRFIEAGRDMLADAPGDRPHLDAMPGARNRIARALAPLVRALQAESRSASADGAYIVPCRDRVLPGDRIRCEVHGRSGYGFSTDGEKWRIEGEVRRVWSHFLVSVRITVRPHDRGPSPGSVVRLPMSELLEFGCVRMLSEDEEARARLEADARRDIAEREELVARQLLERDRGEDHAARLGRSSGPRRSGLARPSPGGPYGGSSTRAHAEPLARLVADAGGTVEGLRRMNGALVFKVEYGAAVLQLRLRGTGPLPEHGGIDARHPFGLGMPQSVASMLDFQAVAGRPAPFDRAGVDPRNGQGRWVRMKTVGSAQGDGLAALGGGSTGTPNVGIGLSDSAREYRLGRRLTSAVRGDPGLEVNLEATRRPRTPSGSSSGSGSERGCRDGPKRRGRRVAATPHPTPRAPRMSPAPRR